MLVPTQHLNNVRLPVGEHHTLSIAQYSADTFCEVALFDDRTNDAVLLEIESGVCTDFGESGGLCTRYFAYVRLRELAKILKAVEEHCGTLNMEG